MQYFNIIKQLCWNFSFVVCVLIGGLSIVYESIIGPIPTWVWVFLVVLSGTGGSILICYSRSSDLIPFFSRRLIPDVLLDEIKQLTDYITLWIIVQQLLFAVIFLRLAMSTLHIPYVFKAYLTGGLVFASFGMIFLGCELLARNANVYIAILKHYSTVERKINF